MDTSQNVRGVVLECLFPYDNDPHQPSPKPHYFLVADVLFALGDQHYVAIAYGTWKLDEDLMRTHRGLILSVDSAHLKGSALPGPVGHFVLDHVALLPLHEDWSYSDFRARFDFMKKEQRETDREHQRLYETFILAERRMLSATDDLLATFDRTQLIGLPDDRALRKARSREQHAAPLTRRRSSSDKYPIIQPFDRHPLFTSTVPGRASSDLRGDFAPLS